MKKFVIVLSAILIGASAYCAAYDYFLKNYATCTPYKMVYVNPLTKERFEKAVLGVKFDNLSRNLYCVYYKQTAKGEYQLCARRTNQLSSDKPFDRKAECRMTNLSGIANARKEVNEKDMVIDNIQTEIYRPIQQ